MDLIRRETPHVTGVSPSLGGSGDPSPATAWGVLWAIRAAAEVRWGDADLAGRHVVVSGVGKVGGALVDHLARRRCAGSRWPTSATQAIRAVRRRATASVAVVGRPTAPTPSSATCSPRARSARCSTARPSPSCAARWSPARPTTSSTTDEDDDRLAERGILYVPDYVANAGGVINIAEEPAGYDHDRAWTRIEGIGDTVTEVLALAERDEHHPRPRPPTATPRSASRPSPAWPASPPAARDLDEHRSARTLEGIAQLGGGHQRPRRAGPRPRPWR